MPKEKDPTLDKILKEVASELGMDYNTVQQLYNGFLTNVEKRLTSVKLNGMTKEYWKKNAMNANIPGFGRFLNRYGKTIKTKDDGRDKQENAED